MSCPLASPLLSTSHACACLLPVETYDYGKKVGHNCWKHADKKQMPLSKAVQCTVTPTKLNRNFLYFPIQRDTSEVDDETRLHQGKRKGKRAAPRRFRLTWADDAGLRLQITGQRPRTYHEIEELLNVVLEEVRLRIASNISP